MHGWRATFSTWAAEAGADHDVREKALAHLVGSEIERAYNHSTLLDKRRRLMDRWARFLTQDQAEVVELRRRA